MVENSFIRFDRIGKRFGGRPRGGGGGVEALRNVSVSFERGECVGIVGPNGAGKSTLFALLLGFLRPSSGTVRIENVPPRDYARARGYGYLPELFDLPSEWRVADALDALARLDGLIDHPEAEASRVLALLGLDEHRNKQVGALSRGLLQRLGIAQALLGSHELVVLDEPTEGLDPLWRIRLREIIQTLKTPERTIIIASHELAEVELLADRTIVLDRGEVRDILAMNMTGETRTVRIVLNEAHDAVEQAFPQLVRHEGREYLVQVETAADLTQRIAALIEAGGVIEAVSPAEGLEERVRRTLDAGSVS